MARTRPEPAARRPLLFRDIFAEQDALAAAKRAFGELVWEEFERSGIVVLRAKDTYPGMRVSLTRSTYPGVLYQVTRWEGDEPTGHLDAQSRASAVDELWLWAGRNDLVAWWVPERINNRFPLRKP